MPPPCSKLINETVFLKGSSYGFVTASFVRKQLQQIFQFGWVGGREGPSWATGLDLSKIQGEPRGLCEKLLFLLGTR